MIPFGEVIACPHCAETLTSGKETSCQNEGTHLFLGSCCDGCGGRVCHPPSVDVVNVSMFPPFRVDIIFWHCDFWTIEYRRFIHIVPQMDILTRLPSVQRGCGT